MPFSKKELVYSGKVKSLFTTEDPQWLIAVFRDDTTAFDGQKHEKLANKGVVNNQINAHIMQALAREGIPTHFNTLLSPHESLVRRLKMIPIECVVRNITAGSLCRRLGVASGLSLDPPLYELFLKNDELHDPMINVNHALAFHWATQAQLDRMEELTLQINRLLSRLFLAGNLLLVDAKFEFGVGEDGHIYLGDEISPDSCRIWDVKTHEILDKDRFRKDMGRVIESYEEIARRIGVDTH
ncbi:MAG: phosphoribosylaminoimidazolesuccinocarboxamide synthase [Coxiella sp. RIFCSPHIGHO2_12_FULL_44_14]|nr:MAG: phosphoribosylaminoimidazolesuccinocarboxamide synthase [Coxiella sp. RIFCSPHIGHO2_12_FULL_44_14]